MCISDGSLGKADMVGLGKYSLRLRALEGDGQGNSLQYAQEKTRWGCHFGSVSACFMQR